MPSSYLMTWESGPRRWRRRHDGTVYIVSVRQLSTHFNTRIPETKEGSYQWANRWWKDKATELHFREPEPHPHQDILDELKSRLEWARRHDPKEAGDISVQVREVERMGEHEEPDPDGEVIAENIRIAETLFNIKVPDEIDPIVADHYFGNRKVHQERRRRDHGGEPVPSNRTLGFQVDRYLDTLFTSHKSGNIGVSEYSNARSGLNHFRAWFGSETLIDYLNAECVERYYAHLSSKTDDTGLKIPESIETRRKFFRYARNLIEWLSSLELIQSPRNLNRKQHRFKGGNKAVPTISTQAITQTILSANGQLKLHLLLMANCGFTQVDISDLHPSEIDWEHGRIKRRRSKEADHEQVPIVDYILWDETFALIKQFRSADPTYALMTDSKKSWVRDSVDDTGKRSRTDAIQSNYRHLNIKDKHPLKMFRKASSSQLDDSEHGKYAVHFLGQRHTVAHAHYISQNGTGFDNAVKWLGEQFGFKTTR